MLELLRRRLERSGDTIARLREREGKAAGDRRALADSQERLSFENARLARRVADLERRLLGGQAGAIQGVVGWGIGALAHARPSAAVAAAVIAAEEHAELQAKIEENEGLHMALFQCEQDWREDRDAARAGGVGGPSLKGHV